MPLDLPSLLDRFLCELDTGLRTVASPARPRHPSPTGPSGEIEAISATEKDRSARLMRVNHSGEVAAQALYRGQAFVAGDEDLKQQLLDAAEEEHDHLAWCQQRVSQLGQRTSWLSPVWYAGSFAIGAAAGLAGDRVSLGFLAETERQVTDHLAGHLMRLPENDHCSRAIVSQMQQDEIQHGRDAEERGAGKLSGPAKAVMRKAAGVMTGLAYWI